MDEYDNTYFGIVVASSNQELSQQSECDDVDDEECSSDECIACIG